MGTVKEYLEALAPMMEQSKGEFIYSLYGFVLDHGETMKYEGYDGEAMEPKQCFANATKLAIGSDNLVYCEGFASGVIPTSHAWCLDLKTGLVVDPTWVGIDEDRDYFGIPFTNKFLLKTIHSRGMYGIIENWEEDFPLLGELGGQPEKWRYELG